MLFFLKEIILLTFVFLLLSLEGRLPEMRAASGRRTREKPIPESIERLIEDQAFSPFFDLAPPLFRQHVRPATNRKTEKERHLGDEREGVGKEPNYWTAIKPGPL